MSLSRTEKLLRSEKALHQGFTLIELMIVVAIIGKAHVGYLPDRKVVGISKLARVVEAFARRLQVQESMTAQIANCIQDILRPKGVGVIIVGEHQCMTTRGVRKHDVSMITSQLLGQFRSDPRTRSEFLSIIGPPANLR